MKEWTKVYGRVQEIHDPEADEWTGMMEFLVLAEIDGKAFCANIMVSRFEMLLAKFDLYGAILDRLVAAIDEQAARVG